MDKAQQLVELKAKKAQLQAEELALENEIAALTEQERLAGLFPAKYSSEIGISQKSESVGEFAQYALGFKPGSTAYGQMMYLATNIQVYIEIESDGSWDIVGFEWYNSDDSRHTYGKSWPYTEEKAQWPK